jgi:hypothetical protein
MHCKEIHHIKGQKDWGIQKTNLEFNQILKVYQEIIPLKGG